MDPPLSSGSARRHTASFEGNSALPGDGKAASPLTTNLPRLSPSTTATTGSPSSPVPPAAPRAPLAPLNPRTSIVGSGQPPPSVFYTYPRPSNAAGEEGLQQSGQSSPPPMRPTSQLMPTAESMELAVVPFVGSCNSSHDPGVLHVDHSSSAGNANKQREGTGSNAGRDDGFYLDTSVAYGELAPTTLSTQRVCPHCLRPFDFYDEDAYDELYDPASPFYRNAEAMTNPARQLPAPPASLTAAKNTPNVPSGNFGAGRGSDLTTPPRVAANVRSGGGGKGSGGGGHGGPVFPPPAIAFTARYFRALPPPAVLAAAAEAGTSPLAIEDYHDPGLENEDEQAEEQPKYNAVMAGGRGGRAISGALVPAKVSAAQFTRGTTMSARRGPASPLKLMHSEEDEGYEQGSSPPSEPRHALRDLAMDEEEERDREASPTSSAYSPNAPGPAPNNGYYQHYFKELRQLGRGTFGGVYLCRHLMCGVNLGDFALKKIPVGDKAGYLQSVLREVRILEEVRRHPNVVEYKHSWVEDAQLADFGPPVRCLFILMEYASAGSLDTYLETYGTNLSTLAVWYFFLSAVAGTAHLHQKQILHRDLKPQNLLLAESKGRPPRVLVSDFGTAAILGDLSYERSGGTGTLEYMAPELFETAASPRGGSEHYVNRHTMASDVWSLGMILYYLAFDATLPERREDGRVILDTPRQASYGRPPEMMHLMEAMLQLDPAKRPRCADMLASARVQAILRTFNQDDWTQWDMLAQQQERARKGATGKTPSPPQAALATRLPPSGKPDADLKLGAPLARARKAITVTSTTAPALQLRRERQSNSNDSALSDNDNLYSSRVVELQSTTALMDLAGDTRPASGAVAGDEQHQHAQMPGRGRHTQHLSSAQEGHDGRRLTRGSAARRPRSAQADSVSSPAGTPPPLTVDAGVQTDPVKIVDE